MTATATRIAADIYVNEAFKFMAAKAGISADEVKALIAAGDASATRYFGDLLKAAVANHDKMMSEAWDAARA